MLFTSKVPGNSSFVFIVVFAILFYLFLIKQGFLSKLLENKVFENIGKTSYSIYCFHPIILAIICKYIIPNNIIPITEQTTSLLFGLYITASILLGMLLYHIFEKPMSKFFSKKIDKII